MADTDNEEACPADLPEQPAKYIVVHATTDRSGNPSPTHQDNPPTH